MAACRYPVEPPKIVFATPVYHPNIDTQGRICCDLLNMPPKVGRARSFIIASTAPHAYSRAGQLRRMPRTVDFSGVSWLPGPHARSSQCAVRLAGAGQASSGCLSTMVPIWLGCRARGARRSTW